MMLGAISAIRSFMLFKFSLELNKEAFAIVVVLEYRFTWFDWARDILSVSYTHLTLPTKA